MKEETDDEIRLKLRRAVMAAFDKWGAQNFDKIVNVWKSNGDPEALAGYQLEDLFMSKRVFILGFFRHVTREVLDSANAVRQLRTVTRASLISMLKTEGVSVRELETKSKEDNRYTRRNVQNLLRERYANTFFKSQGRMKNEGHVEPYSSVFSPHEEPPLTNELQVKTALLKDRIRQRGNSRLMEWIWLNTKIEDVIPERIEFWLKFKRLCRELLLEIGDRSRTGKVLGNELSEPTEIFQVFANHMLSIASIAWFDGRQRETQKDLIHDGFPLKYSLDDAVKVCGLLSELIGADDGAAGVVLNPELDDALKRYERQDIQALLLETCLQLPNLSPEPRGILHEDMAVIHRRNSNPKLMVTEMKRAVAAYKLMPNKYRLAVALKNLGEAEWMLGYTMLAMGYFDQAEGLAEGMDRPNKANVYANLAAAAMRLKQDRLEMRYIGKYLKCAPDEWSARILNASERLGVLSRRLL
jgi:hypothetical protein